MDPVQSTGFQGISKVVGNGLTTSPPGVDPEWSGYMRDIYIVHDNTSTVLGRPHYRD